jgi:hypothetical protein
VGRHLADGVPGRDARIGRTPTTRTVRAIAAQAAPNQNGALGAIRSHGVASGRYPAASLRSGACGHRTQAASYARPFGTPILALIPGTIPAAASATRWTD